MDQKLPRHVAIVMDGNGRWAQQRGLLRLEGHRAGVEIVKTIVKACIKNHIPVLSLFAFSSENWARPTAEVNFLMQLFMESLASEIEQLHIQGVCLQFIGDRHALSSALENKMHAAEVLTQHNDRLVLNVAVNYGGKWDIVEATKTIAKDVLAGVLLPEEIDEATVASRLKTSNLPEPDLFIRTSGEQRISNFFLWPLAYTELYFSEVNWPDFTVEEFEKALTCFCSRQRRYGQTSHQQREEPYV